MKSTRRALPVFIWILLGTAIAWPQPPTSSAPAGLAKEFNRFDRNQDGKLEANEIPEVAPGFMKRLLRQADENSDNVVTKAEFDEAIRQLPPRPRFNKGKGKGRPFAGPGRTAQHDQAVEEDMLTPAYYKLGEDHPFRKELDRFLTAVRKEVFHHPLTDKSGTTSQFSTPIFGKFGTVKGMGQHHPAIDFRVGNRETAVKLYAAHDGIAHSFRNAPKYRHYVSITKDITDADGQTLGKLVTLYGHVDLDLDEQDSLYVDGRQVRKGDLISRHLYSETRGGPHLHFEVRYYRKDDAGTETFYGSRGPTGGDDLTEPSAGSWPEGFWNSNVGYGFGHPKHHGVDAAD